MSEELCDQEDLPLRQTLHGQTGRRRQRVDIQPNIPPYLLGPRGIDHGRHNPQESNGRPGFNVNISGPQRGWVSLPNLAAFMKTTIRTVE